MTDFSYLETWLQNGHRPVILECIPSRSGMSTTVYNRGKRIMTVNGCGFDRIGTALGNFLEVLYKEELIATFPRKDKDPMIISGLYHWTDGDLSVDGVSGFESMAAIADAIGLKVQLSESKAGTLILISKKEA